MLDLHTVGPKLTRPACRAAEAISTDICYPSQTSAAKLPAAAAAVDRQDRLTDGRTLDRFMTLSA